MKQDRNYIKGRTPTFRDDGANPCRCEEIGLEQGCPGFEGEDDRSEFRNLKLK